MRNVVVVTHKFATLPDDDLVIFLNRQRLANVLHLRHSFWDAPDRASYYTWYKKGKIYKEHRTQDYQKLPEPLIYAKEMFFTFKWILGSGLRFDLYVGMDGLCTLFGLMLRFLRRVEKVAYWAMDFVPENRFESRWKNKIYHRVNIFGYKNADEMWDETPQTPKARAEFLGINESDYRKHRIVPYGVWVGRIKKFNYDECEKNTLVFMGNLLEKQGVQLVLKAIPQILEGMPNFRFKIIGAGRYEQELKDLARQLKVLPYCRFWGRIESDQELEEEIAKSCLAVAPYIRKLDTWTAFSGSGKVIKYLCCGVPVLLTAVPYNAQEIEAKGCGMISGENIDELAKKVLLLMDPQRNQEYRENARKFAKNYDYARIFNEIFVDQDQ